MNRSQCPICTREAKSASGQGDSYTVNCERCGNFEISRTAEINVRRLQEAERAILSHKVRHSQGNETHPQITTHDIDAILKRHTLPSPIEQANYLILQLGQYYKHGRCLLDFDDMDNPVLEAIMGCPIGKDGIENKKYILNSLLLSGTIEKEQSKSTTGRSHYRLSFTGWTEYEALRKSISNSKTAFMAMRFRKEQEDNYLHDTLLPQFLAPAVKQTGFDLLNPLAANPKAGNLHARIEVEIRNARFVIADLSHQNNGAYWEAGFARGLNKPVFYICDTMQKRNVHFDTNPDYTVFWDRDNPAAAAQELKFVIRATLPGEAIMRDVTASQYPEIENWPEIKTASVTEKEES